MCTPRPRPSMMLDLAGLRCSRWFPHWKHCYGTDCGYICMSKCGTFRLSGRLIRMEMCMSVLM